MIHLKKGEKTRRILEDGKLQEWSGLYGCWLGMKRKGPEFDMTPDEIAAQWKRAGWKRMTPPDRSRCQAEKPNGAGPFTTGGIPGHVRCEAKPTFIVMETAPGEDGQIGSMSLCDDCHQVFLNDMPEGYAISEPIHVPSEEKS